MKANLKVTLAAAAISMVFSAQAITFNLNTSAASLVLSDNATSTFFQVTGGVESGTAAGLYSALEGGNENDGFWVKISFDGNPQPVLTSALLKAANDYLWWDSTDLAGFNSGTFDSITLWNSGPAGSGIGHYTGGANPQWKFNGTSHAGINGTPGTNRVPDGGASVMLLGMALTTLGVFARRLRS